MMDVNEAVSAAWERVVEKWEDGSRHEALLALVVQHRSFAWAAARYKEKGDDPIAVERLDRLRKAATATMMATATKKAAEERSPYTKTMVWLVVMTIMLIIGLLFARIVTDRAPKHSPPVRHPTGARH
jgi:hypothetical protein